MAQVEITINGRPYLMACDDGQERHLLDLAAQVDRRITELTGAVGQPGEARLLAMACLLFADELAETRAELDALKQDRADADAAPPPPPTPGQDPAMLAAVIDAMAERLETLADRLERA